MKKVTKVSFGNNTPPRFADLGGTLPGMRKVIFLSDHIEITDYDKGRNAVLQPESRKVIGHDGRDTWLSFYATKRGFILTYGAVLALSGYFPTVAEAQAAYGEHADLLRDAVKNGVPSHA